MNIREQSEELERKYLSPYASLSCESQGRDREEEQCDIRTVYQRDRDRIIHCKATIIEQDLHIHWKLHRLQEQLPRHCGLMRI